MPSGLYITSISQISNQPEQPQVCASLTTPVFTTHYTRTKTINQPYICSSTVTHDWVAGLFCWCPESLRAKCYWQWRNFGKHESPLNSDFDLNQVLAVLWKTVFLQESIKIWAHYWNFLDSCNILQHFPLHSECPSQIAWIGWKDVCFT